MQDLTSASTKLARRPRGSPNLRRQRLRRKARGRSSRWQRQSWMDLRCLLGRPLLSGSQTCDPSRPRNTKTSAPLRSPSTAKGPWKKKELESRTLCPKVDESSRAGWVKHGRGPLLPDLPSAMKGLRRESEDSEGKTQSKAERQGEAERTDMDRRAEVVLGMALTASNVCRRHCSLLPSSATTRCARESRHGFFEVYPPRLAHGDLGEELVSAHCTKPRGGGIGSLLCTPCRKSRFRAQPPPNRKQWPLSCTFPRRVLLRPCWLRGRRAGWQCRRYHWPQAECNRLEGPCTLDN